MKYSFIICYENTKGIEDFALTPFLFVPLNIKAKIYGLGICWGFWAIGILIITDKPKGFGVYANLTGKREVKIKQQLKEQ